MKIFYRSISILFLALCALGIGLKVHSLEPGHSLVVSWEGLVIGKNYRDAGQSFNECLGQKLIKTGFLLRANRWFSGFSCHDVGEPDEIYSLNFDPKNRHEFFCHSGSTKVIGKHFNEIKIIKDIEFLDNWNRPEVLSDICGFFGSALASLAKGKKILLHCDAGQDRTGTFAALVQALIAEKSQVPQSLWLDAIECDYRKSPKLVQEKYGRQRRLLEGIFRTTSVQEFLSTKCAIPASVINDATLFLSDQK